jgi:hypothetical protein
MKNLFFLAYLLFVSFNLFSQEQVELYYKLINQAELEICKDEYKSALKIYQEAFILNSEMTYTIDLGNAITVCAKLKQWKKAKNYFIQLKGKGVKDKWLKVKLEQSFPEKIAFLEKLKKVEPSQELQLQRTALELLHHYDQKVRRDCPGYKGACKELVKYVDSITYRKLEVLMKTSGGWTFPITSNGSINALPIYYFPILHANQWKRYWLLEEMEKALYTGKLHPDIYIVLLDRFDSEEIKKQLNKEIPFYAAEIWYQLHNEHYWRIIKEPLKEIDANRAKVFVESVEEFKTKACFQMEHPEFYFSYIPKVKIGAKEIDEEFVQKLILDKKIEPIILEP